jgi:glucose/arabinose dehydrogenase
MKWIWITLACVLLGIVSVAPQARAEGSPTALPPKFTRLTLGAGLNDPTAMAFAGNRIFVTEKGGVIRIIRPDGKLRKKPFHTLSVSANQERGLLGIAIDPNYAANKFIYVYYTTGPGAKRYSGSENRVSRLKRVASGGIKEKILLDHIPSMTSIHNAGDLHFGFDGKLYISVGENGCCMAKAQELDTLLGKILRINKNGTIPEDNPFNHVGGARRETYAYGFRNPWRFAPRASNQTFLVADVGQDTWEEISSLKKGGNYGWPLYEGPCPFNQVNCNTAGVDYAGTSKPIHWYHHTLGDETGRMITGGAFAENSNYPPPYANAFFYADGGGGWLHVLTLDDSNRVVNRYNFDPELNFPVTVSNGPDGNIYVADIEADVIYEYVYTP